MTDAPAPLPDGLGADLAAAALALARRFAAGATMWCCSPEWPHHARHVAVEFVHPVIVGKRALPALAVRSPDLVAELRSSVRPGDVVAAVSRHDDPEVTDALRRARAWGVRTVWVGAGPRPAPGAADHVLWLDDDPALAPHDGRFVLLYHVLWELTHVCFEHPGLLADEAGGCADDVCGPCSDDARLGEVVELLGAADARVRTALGDEVVDVTSVGALRAHDLVLVHAGAAIAAAPEGADP